LAQNRAARLALKSTLSVNINYMHVNLSWLKVEERSTSLLLVFVRGVDVLKVPSYLFKILAWTPMHTPQDMPPDVSSQSQSPEQTMGGAKYYIEP
jgi:hypothetical protein